MDFTQSFSCNFWNPKVPLTTADLSKNSWTAVKQRRKRAWTIYFWGPSQWDKMFFEWVKMFTWPRGLTPLPPPYGQHDNKKAFFKTTINQNNQTTYISFQVGFIIVGAITIWKVSHHSLNQTLTVVGSLIMKPTIAPTLRVERMLSAPRTHTQQWFEREAMEDLPWWESEDRESAIHQAW